MNATVKKYLINKMGRLSSETRLEDYVTLNEYRKVPIWCFNGKTTCFYYAIMDDPSGQDRIRVIATDNWSENRRKADTAAVKYFDNQTYKGKSKSEADDIIAFINDRYKYLSENTQMDKVYD